MPSRLGKAFLPIIKGQSARGRFHLPCSIKLPKDCIACCGLKYVDSDEEVKRMVRESTEAFSQYGIERLKAFSKKLESPNKSLCIYVGKLNDGSIGCMIHPCLIGTEIRDRAPGANCAPEEVCELADDFSTFNSEERSRFSALIDKLNFLEYSRNISTLISKIRGRLLILEDFSSIGTIDKCFLFLKVCHLLR